MPCDKNSRTKRKSKMKEIYIVRHAETDFNRQGIVQGSGVNSSLNKNGQLQAMKFYQKYKHFEFDYIYTSTLKRTHETVQHFINQGGTWRIRGEIREIGWGIHEGKSATPESRVQYQDLIENWKKGNLDAKIEGGESAAEVITRLRKFVGELKKTAFNRALICTHGRTFRFLLSLLNNEDFSEMEKYKVLNTSLYVFENEGDLFINRLQNDLSHLI